MSKKLRLSEIMRHGLIGQAHDIEKKEDIEDVLMPELIHIWLLEKARTPIHI